ncbi:hypothetical protein [Thiosulfatihalobacter marinus]|uniref:hypothetical protein n=1 Tax=Thiosulfatihalobacter marinus TaxID=2792481 RepID=UPI0018D71693|nr:hypothetical protein [Thiosulfatihalobacter marinus]
MIDIPPPQRRLAPFGEAKPFTVHGHRLSSLYRVIRKPPIPFIVLKILNNSARETGRAVLSICGTMKAALVMGTEVVA